MKHAEINSFDIVACYASNRLQAPAPMFWSTVSGIKSLMLSSLDASRLRTAKGTLDNEPFYAF